MTWASPVGDLRTFLSDGPTDKICYRKVCIGTVDGINSTFKTFEYRRVTSFVGVTSGPVGVFVNGARVTVTTDDLPSGEFVLSAAPAVQYDVQATYYQQWFIDSELQTFLTQASNWLGFGGLYIQTGEGLQPAVLNYAAGCAYQKLGQRWVQMMSDVYKMQDAPDNAKAPVNPYLSMAKAFFDSATKARNEFYTRQGQPLSPRFAIASGSVTDVPPGM